HLHPMQRQAALWEREGRPESLLLRDQELEDAESWVRNNPTFVRPVETDLLSLSVTQRQAERRRRRTLIAIGVGLLALVALFGGLGAWALVQRADARHATVSARSLALASAASEHLDSSLDQSLLLALAANQTKEHAQAHKTMTLALETARASGFDAILASPDCDRVVSVASAAD